MVSQQHDKFGGHVVVEMFLVVEEQDSTCSRFQAGFH